MLRQRSQHDRGGRAGARPLRAGGGARPGLRGGAVAGATARAGLPHSPATSPSSPSCCSSGSPPPRRSGSTRAGPGRVEATEALGVAGCSRWWSWAPRWRRRSGSARAWGAPCSASTRPSPSSSSWAGGGPCGRRPGCSRPERGAALRRGRPGPVRRGRWWRASPATRSGATSSAATSRRRPSAAAAGDVLGGLDDLGALLQRQVLDEVVFAVPPSGSSTSGRRRCAAGSRASPSGSASTSSGAGRPARSPATSTACRPLTYSTVPTDELALAAKRAFDILVSGAVLALMAPVHGRRGAGHPARVAGPGALPPAAGRAERPRVRPLQVPQHAPGRRGPARGAPRQQRGDRAGLQDARRSPGHPRRPLHPPRLARRVPPVLERAPRRDEHRRPPPAPPRRGAPVPALAAAPAQRAGPASPAPGRSAAGATSPSSAGWSSTSSTSTAGRSGAISGSSR